MTGGSGYIDRSVVPALVEHGHALRALARSESADELVSTGGAEPPDHRRARRSPLRAAGFERRTVSVPRKKARETFGPIADAFAHDRRFDCAKARTELGWMPTRTDVLAEIACGV